MYKLLFLMTAVFLTSCTNVDLAPFYEDRSSEKGTAIRALGPFYENLKLSNGHERHAIRPIWSYEKFEERVAMDFIWPLSMSRLDKDYYRSNFLLFFYHNMDVKKEDSEYLFWFFPFWFQGQDRRGEDYKGLFPIWGSTHDTIGFDRISWRFFPVNLKSQKGEIKSDSWFWPIYSTTTGPKIEKWRIWPFYGESHEKEKSDSSFILWPFWHEGKSLVKGKTGEWFFFFPFYGKYEFEHATKTTVLWPFFSWSDSDKEEEVHAPWPFYTERETKDGKEERFRAWPFYTSYKAPNKINKQYAWPIGTYSRLGDDKTYEERSWWLPLYWSSKLVKDEITQEDYTRFWPFYSKTVNGDKTNIAIFSLWPQRHMPAIERNWQTIWEPYRYYKDENVTSHDILWGLSKYKEDKSKKSESFSIFPFYEEKEEDSLSDWSVFKGFFGRKEKSSTVSEYSLLWFIKFEAGN